MPVAAPPVVIQAPKTPCVLPDLPGPIVLDAAPMAGNPDGLLISRAKLAELGGYLVRAQGWIETAQGCIGAKK